MVDEVVVQKKEASVRISHCASVYTDVLTSP